LPLMKIEDFDFALPPSQIAQAPLPERDASKLLRLSRSGGEVEHARFRDLPELLRSSDLVVVNDTRVFSARLVGKKANTGGRAELLLVRPAGSSSASAALEGRADGLDWICLGQSSKGLKPETKIELDHGSSAEVIEALEGGEYRVRLSGGSSGNLAELLKSVGRVPLPPYIARDPDRVDEERYQTVYARRPGSVAAPTAGLHFTPGLLAQLEARGIELASLTLDVGPGTFLPIREREIERHRMHSEPYFIPESTARAVVDAKRQGRRIVAVGTTVVRALETATEPNGVLKAGAGETSLFIRPGFRFLQIDALLTNFHLPKSTLLMLVSAFAGRERVLAAYEEAVRRGYRFFSYGDAMLISD
jgi:S-adenosylmethionine:tRNA ribosyltransferase-isomerase